MSKNNLIYIVLAVLILGGLLFLLKPKTYSNPTQPQASNKTFDLVIRDKNLAGPDTLTVTEGDQVIFNIKSDENEELHLHGYDISTDLEASKEAQLKFTADKTGRFPFELEHSKTELGALEVQPK